MVASTAETEAMIVVLRVAKEASVASSEESVSEDKGSLILYVPTQWNFSDVWRFVEPDVKLHSIVVYILMETLSTILVNFSSVRIQLPN